MDIAKKQYMNYTWRARQGKQIEITGKRSHISFSLIYDKIQDKN